MHWVTENGIKYSPVTDIKTNKLLHGQIIRTLNKALEKTNKPVDIAKQKFKAYIASCDTDYRVMSVVRSFYDRVASHFKRTEPVTYIISGDDVGLFEEYLAKNIGIEKGIAKRLTGEARSAKSDMAVDMYNNKGLEYVNNPNYRIKDRNGKTYVLHTKFKILRSKTGKVKGYEFQDAKFLPEKGAGNPLEK